MVRFVFVFISTVLCCANGRYIIENKTIDSLNSDAVEETQHAVCRIVTEELQATANVTLTRELKGVCTSDEISSKLEKLQHILLNELHLIRQELKNGVQLKSVQGNEDTQEAVHQFSSKQKRTIEEDFERIRTSEILKYNATINTSTKGIRYFYYYWKLENINEILSDNRGISVKSPSFALFGISFHILLYPHHRSTKYVGIQLKCLSRGQFLKHRFTILDHNSINGDLNSQLLGDPENYAIMYRVAHDKIENRNFINDDYLIIKITINLE